MGNPGSPQDCNRDYYTALVPTEKVFKEKYISPHIEVVPNLAEDYATACRGEVPSNFIGSKNKLRELVNCV
jgi:hypothetical protein